MGAKKKNQAHTPERRYPRYSVKINSVVLSSDRSYAGAVENVCEEGLAYSMDTLTPTVQEFTPEKMITLIFTTSAGETLNLNCEIRWASVDSPWPLPKNYSTLGMGMRVIDPPAQYRQYVKELR